MSKLFNSDDDDFGYLDDSIHINWKKLFLSVIEGKKYLQMHLQPKKLRLSVKQIPTAIIL